jgi:hypothetical protein
MRTLTTIICIVLVALFNSCATVQPLKNMDKEQKVAGYTLKSKKELLQQKVLNTKVKTVVAQP